MLLDTGAYQNLVGDKWVARMDELNRQHGKPEHSTQKLAQKITLGGVGAGTQEANESVDSRPQPFHRKKSSPAPSGFTPQH